MTPRQRCGDLDFSARRDQAAAREATASPAPGRLGPVQTGSSPVCGPSARQLRVQKKESLPILRQIFPKNIAGDFTSKWRWVGDPKNQGPFSPRKLKRKNLAICGGDSEPRLFISTKAGSVATGTRQSGQQGGVAFGQRICMEAGRTIQCAAPTPSSSPSIHNPISAARENDVGGYHKPKCVIADKGDLDKYPHDCKAHQNERERTSVLHPTSPTRRNRIKQTVPRFALQERFTL
jgi:hypothetical protein